MALGARSAADATASGLPLSRGGADAGFGKLELRGRYRYAFAENMFATVSARAQTSFGKPMVTAEQIGIGKANELSSFDEGTMSGDSGWIVRGEVAQAEVRSFLGVLKEQETAAEGGT